MPDLDKDTINFLREREQRLEGRMKYRTYSLYYGSNSGESREYGVFLYTDGETFIFEDFDRPPQVMGIEIKRKNQPEYIKMEHTFTRSEVDDIETVTRQSALDAVKYGSQAKPVSGLMAKLRKTLTEVTLKDGTKYYFELMDPEVFFKLFTAK